MPFDIDVTTPGDSSLIAAFPANERTHRTTLENMWNTEHDEGSARHKFGIGTTTQRDAITDWVVGALWINTTLGGVIQYVSSIGPVVWSTADGWDPGDMILAPFTGAKNALWLLCDGSEYAVATYPDLAQAFGATGVGDGVWDQWDGAAAPAANNFRVPDFGGYDFKGFDSGQADYDAVADAAGDKQGGDAKADSVTLVEANIPEMTTDDPGNHGHSYGLAGGGPGAAGSGTISNVLTTTTGQAGAHTHTVGTASPTAVDLRTPYATVKPYVHV